MSGRNNASCREERRFFGRHRQSGQAMTEYTIILFFGLMVLLGPGIDVLKELANVMRRNYEGYSHAISLSPLPDYDSGAQMRLALQDEQIDQATIGQLAVDPLDDFLTEKIEEYLAFKDQIVQEITDVAGAGAGSTISGIWDDGEDDAVSFFQGL